MLKLNILIISSHNFYLKSYCCHCFQCFIFHLYKGVRAGGGIGDEIEPPDGDDYEVYRIMFDITFFFFVIIILLAIIQGLYAFINDYFKIYNLKLK